MKTVENQQVLPKDYTLFQTKDLKNDKKIALMIQVIFLIIAGLMVLIAFYFKLPIKNDLTVINKLILTLSLVALYMILHELTHGLFIWFISKHKPSFGFHFPYLITGSNNYYNKRSFIVILLAPVVIFGIVLILCLLITPQTLFLSLYIVIGLNFAGSSGDYVQAYMIKRLPSNVLIKDDGKNTTYYLNENRI